MAECPNCGTEVRPEWSLCPHCKVNMRTYAGPRGGYVHPVTPLPSAQVSASPAPTAPAPPVPAPAPPAVADECPTCGAPLPSADTEFCPQCGNRVKGRSIVAWMRRVLANRAVVGALALVFVVLLAGIVVAGPADPQDNPPGPTDTPRVTPVSPAVPTIGATTKVPTTPAATRNRGAVNASATNTTPRPNETVLVIKTLSRYIQNAGGDPGNQLRTPTQPPTPVPPSPVSTSASRRVGDLSWSGEGSYVTDPFALGAGTVRVSMTARVLTMAQLRDASGTAIGVATAGPGSATTDIRVPIAGTYRLEVWPFGSGAWTVTISTTPLATPSVEPVPPARATTAVPVTTILPAVSIPGTVTPEPSEPEPTTLAPTEEPTPAPTQPSRTFTGNGTTSTPPFTLNEGLARFSYSTAATGTFSLALVGSGETVLAGPSDGPLSGSKGVAIPATGQYLLNVVAAGPWEVSIS